MSIRSIEKCIKVCSESKIKFAQKGKTLILLNENRIKVKKIKIDNCLMANKCACDYVAEFKNNAYYIELKGSEIKKAESQIVSTLKYLKTRHNGWEKTAIIIHSSVPAFNGGWQRVALAFNRFNTKLCCYKTRKEIKIP